MSKLFKLFNQAEFYLDLDLQHTVKLIHASAHEVDNMPTSKGRKGTMRVPLLVAGLRSAGEMSVEVLADAGSGLPIQN